MPISVLDFDEPAPLRPWIPRLLSHPGSRSLAVALTREQFGDGARATTLALWREEAMIGSRLREVYRA